MRRLCRALVGEMGLRVAGPGQGSGGRRRVRAGTRDTTDPERLGLGACGTRTPAAPQTPCTGGGADPLRTFSRASLSYWCVRSPPQAEDAWKDVSLYFSGDEWAAMGDWEKGRYRNLKRNFEVLLSLGIASLVT